MVISAALSLASGTDAEEEDYTPQSDLEYLSVEIPTGVTTQTFAVTFVDDAKVEDDETIIYEITAVETMLSRTDAIQIGTPSTIELVITDNDDGMF